MTTETLLISGAVVLAVILLGWLWRWLRKRHAERAIDKMPITIVDRPTEQDKRAYELLRGFRREAWKRWGEELQLNPRSLYQISFETIRKVASVYYPDAEEPQYKATVDGLLDLNARIVRRLQDLLDKPIVNRFRSLDVATIMSIKKGYDYVWKNPVAEFIKSPRVRAATRTIFDAVNVFNPWHWGRRVLVDVGIETARRYFVTGLVTIVGEEAVMLFSGRRVRNEKAAAELLTAYEMVRELSGQESVSAEEYAVLLRWLVKFKHLDSHTKFNLLRMLQGRRKLEEQDLSELLEFGPDGGKLFLRAFGELAEAGGVQQAVKMMRLEKARRLLIP